MRRRSRFCKRNFAAISICPGGPHENFLEIGPWDSQSSRKTKGTVTWDFNSPNFSASLAKRGGGEGGLRTISWKIICSRSSSITFYRSLGMPNQAERQKERSQGTSIQQTSMPYWPSWGGGGSENNRLEDYLLQIQFYHVL